MAVAAHSSPIQQASIDALKSLVDSDLERVNTLILSLAQSHVELIPKLSHHVIRSGGKRLRPILTLACAKLCGYEGERHVALAAAVEFIHTATLLHDDVVDESQLRRGIKTANNLWDNKACILIGDYILSQAFKLMVKDGSLTVLDILSSASAVIAEGEVLQLSTTNNLNTTLDSYYEVIGSKTAVLFAAACEIGAVVADTLDKQEALRLYGHHLGVAFQIVDDILDYSADQRKLGKTVGDDFAEGKVTLPIILSYADAKAEEKAFWERTIQQLEQQPDDMARAVKYLRASHAMERATEMAIAHAQDAKAQLAAFPASPMRSALDETADFCIQRLF